jgi:hypothetical protein
MSADSDVWLGDVIQAWDGLNARTDAARKLVAELLGFHLALRREETGQEDRVRVSPQDRPAVTPETPPDDVDPNQPAAAEARAPVVVPLGPPVYSESKATDESPRWRLDAVPLEPERRDHVTFAPQHEPLFDPQWTRALVGALCGTRAADGPIDVAAAVERLSQREALSELPREQVTTLRRGVQLLVDHGDSLMPFMRDIDDLSTRIVEIVGRDRTTVLHFSACPLYGAGAGGPSTWGTSYSPPPARTPVVVITDLGRTRGAMLRGAAPERDWLAFAARVAAAECPAIAVVPLPRSQPFGPLARAFRILSWDRTTPVMQARRIAADEAV